MILFISGRTDICSYYPLWFFNRVKEGYVDVRNPFYNKLVSRIYFNDVDLLVFCTKNIHPFLPYLDKISSLLPIPFIFHITLTPYNKDIEPIIANNKKTVIEDIRFLARKYGKNHIFLRYDPIIINNKYTISYHLKAFNKLISEVGNFISYVVISFVDLYKNTLKNNHEYLKIKELNEKEKNYLASEMQKITSSYNIKIFTCGEKEKFLEYGFINGSCINKEYVKNLFSELGIDKKMKYRKNTNRPNSNCNCLKMVDIGDYNSCLSFCRYCYANFDENKVKANYQSHDDNSSLLIGKIKDDDIIKVRKE